MKKEQQKFKIDGRNIMLLKKYPFSVVYGIIDNDGSVTVFKIPKRKMRDVRKTIFDRLSRLEDNAVSICTIRNLTISHESADGEKLSSRKGAISLISYKPCDIKMVIYVKNQTLNKMVLVGRG